MSLSAGSVISVRSKRTDKKYKLTITYMERKKITFDSFIRGAIGCGRNINAGGTTERSVIALLYCVADRLHGLSAGQILPIQAEVEKSYRLYPLCIIPDYSCRSILILSVSTANDFGNQQNE